MEEVARHVFDIPKNKSVVYELKDDPRFDDVRSSLQSCAEVRNLLQHNLEINNKSVVDVSDETILFLKDFTQRIKNRPRCRNICIKFKDVYWRNLNDSVKATMIEMKKHLYTHVPIIENNKVIGVFDENSLFEFIVNNKEGIFELDEHTTFNDMKDFLSLNCREMETFEFFKSNDYVDNLEILFEKRLVEGKRVGLVFLTKTGNSSDKVQGILTLWDLANKKQKSFSNSEIL